MLSELFDWWQNLVGFELILWCIALLFSLLFVIQTVISFVVSGDHSDIDAAGDDGHGDATQFFTLRNMIAFFTMFGWTGLAAYKSGIGTVWVTIIAVASGVLMVYILYFLMQKAGKLKQSGTLEMKNAISKIGETYLRIPGQRGGIGKIQIQVQGRYMELEAMTDDVDDISTGRPVKVVNTLNERILLVTSTIA